MVGGQIDDDRISMQEVMTEPDHTGCQTLAAMLVISHEQLPQVPLVIREAGSPGTRMAVDAALPEKRY